MVFAGDRPDEALAIERLTNAYRSAGVAHIDFAYEPLGAAYWYARTIQRQETVLVADFGGGTSDFSVVRFDLGGARTQAEALSHAGVGVAGDTFDFRIVDNLVSPRLGKGASYRSFGKILPLQTGDIERIGAAIDVALERASVTVETVDSVFMTGGTSYVPGVRRLFEQRFDLEKLHYGDAFNAAARAVRRSPKTAFVSRTTTNDRRFTRSITMCD